MIGEQVIRRSERLGIVSDRGVSVAERAIREQEIRKFDFFDPLCNNSNVYYFIYCTRLSHNLLRQKIYIFPQYFANLYNP